MKEVYLDSDGIHKYEVQKCSKGAEKVTCFELIGNKWIQLGTECYDNSSLAELLFGMTRIQ